MQQNRTNEFMQGHIDRGHTSGRIEDILKDTEKVRQAKAALTVKSRDKKLDVFLRSRIIAMLGTLNLWMDPQVLCTWKEASVIVTRAQGSGAANHARNIRKWTLTFLHMGQLPLHQLRTLSSVLFHEDISQELQLHVTEAAKNIAFSAEDLVKIVASDGIQHIFQQNGIIKPSISVRTAQRWLAMMSWKYGKVRKGMYIDGHERDDVVAYRKAFVARWKEYEKRFRPCDENGNPLSTGFPIPQSHGQPQQLILITHDESTFYQNDERHNHWALRDAQDPPKPKGNGQSIMVSDFMTVEWGWLQDGPRCIQLLFYSNPTQDLLFNSEACILIKPGKNRDGYFTNEDLVTQVDCAIDIFNTKTSGSVQGLWMFDNAPNHMKRAANALSAREMPKGVYYNFTSVWHPE
jgi:hypothetical protein